MSDLERELAKSDMLTKDEKNLLRLMERFERECVSFKDLFDFIDKLKANLANKRDTPTPAKGSGETSE